jgi:hypothetical protein
MTRLIYTDVLCSLEYKIKNGKNIFVFFMEDKDFLSHLCDESKKIRHDIEIWQSIEKNLNDSCVKYVSDSFIQKVIEVHNLYDFSDKISIVTRCNQYGSIMNYVKNGILTKNEMIDALLFGV